MDQSDHLSWTFSSSRLLKPPCTCYQLLNRDLFCFCFFVVVFLTKLSKAEWVSGKLFAQKGGGRVCGCVRFVRRSIEMCVCGWVIMRKCEILGTAWIVRWLCTRLWECICDYLHSSANKALSADRTILHICWRRFVPPVYLFWIFHPACRFLLWFARRSIRRR